MAGAAEQDINIKPGVLRSTDNGDAWTAGDDPYARVPEALSYAISGPDGPAMIVPTDEKLMAFMGTDDRKLYQEWGGNRG